MAFFDKLSETLTTTGKAAAQKTKEMADLAKLSAQVTQQESKIKTWYQVIGEKVYKQEKDQDHAGLEAEFDLITDAFAEIAKLKKQIADIKGVRECAACGAEVDAKSLFCPKCGAKMEEEAPAEEMTEDAAVAADVVEEEGPEAAEKAAEEAAETAV